LINFTAQFNSTIDHIKAGVSQSRLSRNRLALLAWRVGMGMKRDDATYLAAGVAFFTIFSIFPLILGLLAIVGLVLHSEESQQRFLQFVANNLPGSVEFVANNLERVVRLRGILGIGAIIGLVWVGRLVFAAMTRAINRAWGIRKDRPFYIAIPRQMAMTMILGGLLLLSTAGTSFIQLLSSERFLAGEREPLLDLGLSALALYLIPWAITLLVFLLIYRYVPNRRMHWRYVWPGAVTAAVFFETGKLLFWWYLENIAIYDQVYGPLTSVVVLMIWAYLSAWVLILGAEISYEYERIFYPQDQEEIQLTAPSSSP
jgi:membrane protein